MTFRFLDHTADIRVECIASNFAELLQCAACALYAIALKETRASLDAQRIVEVFGAGREDVLVRWLQELLFLLDTGHFVAVEFAFDTVEAGHVKARLNGYTCNPEDRAEEVKSATYHQLEVIETADGWLARLIFDL